MPTDDPVDEADANADGSSPAREIKVCRTPAEVVAEAADRVARVYDAAVAEGELFSLFLSGGSTPKALYQLLASDAYRERFDWRQVELYFGDERCVPPDSDLSNYKLADDFLISKVPIPADNVRRMKGEIDPERAATEYGQMLKQRFPGDGGPDVILLGMGDDGHTASLFPQTAALREEHHRCVANHVPHDYIPAGTEWRVTLTFPFINRAKQAIVMVTGAGKATRVQAALEGPDEFDHIPIQRVRPTSGRVVWLLDAGAAGME